MEGESSFFFFLNLLSSYRKAEVATVWVLNTIFPLSSRYLYTFLTFKKN